MDDVVVVGAGVSGVACALELRRAGRPFRLLDRGRRPGGRMAARPLPDRDGLREVEIGAPYFTVSDPGFEEIVRDWHRNGLVRPWTDTLHVVDAEGGLESKVGPTRWAANGGMRSLVEYLARDLTTDQAHVVRRVGGPSREGGPVCVDGGPAPAVVLAMPTPQAHRVLAPELAAQVERDLPGLASDTWSPVLSAWARWERPWWRDQHAGLDIAALNGSDVLDTVLDDGRRRGDDVPVLVLHSTAAFAAARLDDPLSGLDPMLRALEVLNCGRPVVPPQDAWVHRWSFARPDRPADGDTFERSFGLSSGVGFCGDGWGGRSRIEAAWVSGRELGRRLAA